MRLIHFRIDGYKSLRDAATYVNGRMVAFVGPNEAGKSSVLEALALLTNEEPLASHLRSRSGESVTDDHTVVSAEFVLDDSDRALLEGLELAGTPHRLVLLRSAGGGAPEMRFEPKPLRDSSKLQAARNALEQIESRLAALMSDLEEGSTDHAQTSLAFGEVSSAIASFDDSPPSYREIDWTALADALNDVAEEVLESRHEDALAEFSAQLQRPSPARECEELIARRVPPFLLLDQATRDLRTSYNLADPDLLERTPPALQHLLSLAGTTARQIAEVLDDRARRETLIEQANLRLRDIFQARWAQSDLSVHLNTTGTELDILIYEPAAAAKTGLDERSDGLRTFVALVSYVGADRPVPPILLIDEAENHLHYNAQADLINMLSDRDVAVQVLYTTHSPGCLPRDLGYGVRFVEPNRRDRTSRIRHDFWAYEDKYQRAGFSPLLFVMGAGAAAFASLRHAVVGEGPSDMLLLPSLLRSALGVDDLPYQVAPGVSTLASSGFPTLGTIASSVCYLTDGDAGGASLRETLLAQGVPDDHVMSLPTNWAVEDLVDRRQYLTAVAETIDSMSSLDHLLDAPAPIKKAVRDELGQLNARAPSTVVVAEHLLGAREPILAREEARECLAQLDAKFRRVLGLAAEVDR